MREWIPERDFAVVNHGFAAHGRDYILIQQAGSTYELTLTHVVEFHYETRVSDDVWPVSWDDCMPTTQLGRRPGSRTVMFGE